MDLQKHILSRFGNSFLGLSEKTVRGEAKSKLQLPECEARLGKFLLQTLWNARAIHILISIILPFETRRKEVIELPVNDASFGFGTGTNTLRSMGSADMSSNKAAPLLLASKCLGVTSNPQPPCLRPGLC